MLAAGESCGIFYEATPQGPGLRVDSGSIQLSVPGFARHDYSYGVQAYGVGSAAEPVLSPSSVRLGTAAVGSGQAMGGFDGRTWWILVALTVGPQLLGHSVFNRVLPVVGSTVVSTAILLEVLGSVLLAWWWFDEVPEPAAIPAGVLLLAGLFVVATDRSTAPAEVVTA